MITQHKSIYKYIAYFLVLMIFPSYSCDGEPRNSNSNSIEKFTEKRNSPGINRQRKVSISTSKRPNPSSESRVINVKSFGARGDGKSDDTRAINRALATGNSVYLPQGEYVIKSGALILKGKKNIRIYGDGDKTWIHPPDQLKTTSKTTFYSTFCIDNCTNIRIENMRIESKGENWGDTDSGAKLAWGDERTEWVIQKGGHAMLIARSTNIVVNKVTGRFCGSTGVFYASSCDSILFRNCFANAASLGYGGFCADNFVDASFQLNPQRRYYFENCEVIAESEKYPNRRFSSKAGIIVEGDNGRIINTFIKGGRINDCGSGGNAKNAGAAILIENSNVICKNVVAHSNYMGLKIKSRSEIEQPFQAEFDNCKFYSNKVCGIYVNTIGKKGGSIVVKNSNFSQEPISVWKFTHDTIIGETAGILVDGFMTSKMIIENSSFTGGEKYILALDKCNLFVRNSIFENSSKNTFIIHGGGELIIENSTIDLTQQPTISNRSYNNKYQAPIKLKFRNNILRKANARNHTWIMQSGNRSIQNDITISENSFIIDNSSKKQTSSNKRNYNGIIESYALQEKNTSLIIALTTAIESNIQYIKPESNIPYKILLVIPAWEGKKKRIKVFLRNDVRKFFPVKTEVMLY